MPPSPLLELLQLPGIEWVEQDGCRVPASFAAAPGGVPGAGQGPVPGAIEEEYWALKESAGLMDLTHRGKLLVRGKDAPRLLHGMVTNEVKEMLVGHGNYAFFLDVQGHIQADARILRLDGQSYLVDLEPQRVETIRQILDKHIIADDVEVRDDTAALGLLALEGPCALEVLREAIGFEPPHLLPLEHLEVPQWNLRLARASASGGFGYWLWGPAGKLAEVWRKGAKAGLPLGVRPVGLLATEICRIEAGLPRYGADMSDKTLPQETGQLHALSFTKGCYLGQEIVERIRARGHVNRRLVGLLFQGRQDISPGAELTAAGQPAGNVTSAAYSYGLRRTIALAMVRRESAEPDTLLTVALPSGNCEAAVAALPFFYPMARTRN